MSDNIYNIDPMPIFHSMDFLMYYLTGGVYLKDLVGHAYFLFGEEGPEGLAVDRRALEAYFFGSLDFQQLVWQEKYKLMDLDESSVIRGLYDDSSGDFLFYEPDKLRERVRTASGMIRENLEKIALYERKQIMESVEDFCGRITQWSDPVTRGSHPGIHTDERDIEILYRYCSIFYTLRKMMFRNIQEMTSALFLYFVKIFGPITFGQIKKLFPHRIIETVRQFGERLAESGYVEIGDGKQGGRGAKCRISKKGDRYLSRMLRYIDEKINASARKDYEKTTEIVGITKDLFEAATSVFVRHR